MSTTDDEGMVPVEAVGLVAMLVQANADFSSHITNSLLANTERRERYFAGALCRLVDMLYSLPDSVMTVAMANMLDSVAGAEWAARDTLHRDPLHGDRDPHEYVPVRWGGAY